MQSIEHNHLQKLQDLLGQLHADPAVRPENQPDISLHVLDMTQLSHNTLAAMLHRLDQWDPESEEPMYVSGHTIKGAPTKEERYRELYYLVPQKWWFALLSSDSS